MMGKIGIFVESISSLKVLGPVIDIMIKTGRDVSVFLKTGRKGKFYDALTTNDLRHAFPCLQSGQIIKYEVAHGQLRLEATQDLETAIVLNPYRNQARETLMLAKQGVKVAGLDYFANSVYVAATTQADKGMKEVLEALRWRMVATEWWRDFELAVEPEHNWARNKFVAVGTPLGDVFKRIDYEKARSELGIAGKHRIVSVFTPNIRAHQAYFFYGLATRVKLRRLANWIKEYCRERGYVLITKSRKKQWDAEAFRRLSDIAIDDMPQHIYPSTSANLLSVSDLVIHFGSMMVLEAAAAKVPAIAIEPDYIDKLHTYMRPDARETVRKWALTPSASSLFAFDDVSAAVSLSGPRLKSDELADSLMHARDRKGFAAYNEKFTGCVGETTATERMMNMI